MIYDAFLFRGAPHEMDLLEIRLMYLWDVVDYFVISECRHTFSGLPKPLTFMYNRPRFGWAVGKIRYIDSDGTAKPDGKPASRRLSHQNQLAQRKALIRGVSDSKPGDVILSGDLDEIPSKLAIQEASEMVGDVGPVSFVHNLRRYYVNTGHMNKDGQPAVANKNFAAMTTQEDFVKHHKVRFGKRGGRQLPKLGPMGWHLSLLGGAEAIKQKLSISFHREFNRPPYNDLDHINKFMANPRVDFISGDRMGVMDVPECIPSTGFEHLIFKVGDGHA